MKIKKTYIAYDEIDIPVAEDGKDLRKIVKQFIDGEVDDLNSLLYLVERNEDYDVFYGVQFNLDDTNPKEVYRDIYISSNIIDYTSKDNLLIEIEDEHMGNFDFAHELFKQLESRPCVSLYSIVRDGGFDYVIRRGFSRTSFEAEIKLLD